MVCLNIQKVNMQESKPTQLIRLSTSNISNIYETYILPSRGQKVKRAIMLPILINP